jgi:hypothetical protein
MRSRRINKKVMEAVRNTIVPPSDFCINSMESYNAMAVMTEAMPNLQQLEIGRLGARSWYLDNDGSPRDLNRGHKYSDGEDPDEEMAASTAHYTTYNIEIISNFSKLKILDINTTGYMNGSYPILFNSFPLLQKLSMDTCFNLKWDLEMLDGLPLLKELYCSYNPRLTGNITSLRVLKDTLEKVNIDRCPRVEGNFMDLADFPRLNALKLAETAVTGDIRDIGERDFPSLKQLTLPKGVYGGWGCEFQRISDAPDLVRSLYLLKKRRPALAILKEWRGELSADSPDWYESEIDDSFPFYIYFVKAGSRIGYQWESSFEGPCEVNWLDPEPERETCDYEKYIEELCDIDAEVKLFKGFHQPPLEEEYNRILDEHATREESGNESEESDESDESDEGYSSEEW